MLCPALSRENIKHHLLFKVAAEQWISLQSKSFGKEKQQNFPSIVMEGRALLEMALIISAMNERLLPPKIPYRLPAAKPYAMSLCCIPKQNTSSDAFPGP